MANVFAPYGARLRVAEGKLFRVRRYPKVSGNVIADGDLVIPDASGAVDLGSNTGPYVGVAIEYKTSADVSAIAVIDDPEAVFEMQTDNLVASTAIFMNAQITYAAPDTSLQRSKTSLKASSVGTGNPTYPLKILGLSDELGNAWGSFAKVIVKINNHVYKGGTGTAGV